ncbi:hypothetical protein ACQP0C_06305 [Nocardia sp. CA-129566]|uniref:hypothetical protein n=1 Tax=Nocardia sp. CA-129566 TaxID=3239976 RepID=UPI003D99411B
MSERELVGRSGLPAGAREFRGDFEVHITVRAGATGVDALERYAGQRNMKFTQIVLARGRVCDQPMVTVRRSGTLAAVRDSASELVEGMRDAGFAVVRVKLEASPLADGVPENDIAARELGAQRPQLRMFLAAANSVDWREFAEQHPHLAYAHQEFVWRFAAGLIPTLPYETRALYRTLLTDRVVELSELRAALASGGLSAVAERIAESDWSTLEQVVLVRKLLGRAECSLHQAADLVAAIQPGLMRDAGDYRGLGDPHRIATALAPYV